MCVSVSTVLCNPLLQKFLRLDLSYESGNFESELGRLIEFEISFICKGDGNKFRKNLCDIINEI